MNVRAMQAIYRMVPCWEGVQTRPVSCSPLDEQGKFEVLRKSKLLGAMHPGIPIPFLQREGGSQQSELQNMPHGMG